MANLSDAGQHTLNAVRFTLAQLSDAKLEREQRMLFEATKVVATLMEEIEEIQRRLDKIEKTAL